MSANPTYESRPFASSYRGQTEERLRLRRLAWLLDSSIPLPGGFRVGLDGLIGLIPGVGDVVAASLSTYILAEGMRMGVSASVLARMAFNVLLELLIGVIPVAGDAFDFVFKANERNVRLIEAHLDNPRATRSRSRWHAALVVTGIIVMLLVALSAVVAVTGAVWTAVTS